MTLDIICGCRKEKEVSSVLLNKTFSFCSGSDNVPAVPATKLSKFLFIPPALGDIKNNCSARVLTSKECVQMLEEKQKKRGGGTSGEEESHSRGTKEENSGSSEPPKRKECS